MLLADAEIFLQRVHFLPSRHDIPSWTTRGIHHGFTGISTVCPRGALSLEQLHSSTIVLLEREAQPQLPCGDGLISLHPQQIIAVKTADCLPLLISHPKGVMALHAGWKGLAADIVGEAMRWMKRQAWHGDAIEIALGPCISFESFEVGPEVLAVFRGGPLQMRDHECALAASKGQGDRWHLDLATLALLQLKRFHIPPQNISVIRTCTKKLHHEWHSFRRDGAKAGRNWSWIQFGGSPPSSPADAGEEDVIESRECPQG